MVGADFSHNLPSVGTILSMRFYNGMTFGGGADSAFHTTIAFAVAATHFADTRGIAPRTI
jgi:hypothetical protein